MTDRRAAPVRQAARARLSLGRWTGALVGTAAVIRCGVGLLSLFAIGPLSGLAAYPVWAALGNGPIVAEWLVAGVLVVAGTVIATRVRSIWTYRQARIVGWFVVLDSALYVASLTVVLAAGIEAADDSLWSVLTALIVANIALAAMGAVVIRKAGATRRVQRDLLRGCYLRKPRPDRTGVAA